MSLIASIADSIRTVAAPAPRAGPISDLDISLADWVEMQQLGMPWGFYQTMQGNREEIERSFSGLVYGAYRSNGVIFACVMTRFLLFSEARFQFQQMRGGQPGDLFGTPALATLEHPWPGATTGDLLSSQILDVDFAGNGIAVRRPGRIERLRPDWVQLVIGSTRPADDFNPWDPDAQLIGITYQPGGPEAGEEPMTFTMDEVSHFAPIRDPVARFRGMSWLQPIVREIQGDSAAMSHKLAYFENGATPSLILKSGISDRKLFNEHIERFRKAHEGASKAYKTLHLMLGADAMVVGSNLEQQAFKDTIGHGETRIAAAAGIHPAIVGLSEGLQGSNLNDSVIRAAAKLAGNKTLRPLWRNLSGSLERIVPPLAGTRLWYDDRHIPFLAEDIKDEAEVVNRDMLTIESGIRGGWTPESIRDAVTSRDLRRLQHTGLFSVQLQPPGSGDQAAVPAGQPVAYHFVELPQYAGTPLATGLPKLVGDRVAISDFTPSSGLLAEFGPIDRGTVLPADAPHVRAFPSLFEAADVRVYEVQRPALGPGPSQIVSRLEVLEKKAELAAEGRPAGYDSVAAALNVSPTTVRRRLAEDDEPRREPLADAIGALAAAVAARPDASVNVSTPVTVHPPDITIPPTTIAEGAVQVHVEAPTTIEKGAISPPSVTVEPSPVTIAEGAIQVEVNAPTTIEKGAVSPPSITMPPTVIEEGAVKVEVTAPPMIIEKGAVEVNVENAPPAISGPTSGPA